MESLVWFQCVCMSLQLLLFYIQPILNVLPSNISRSFNAEDSEYGLLYLSNGSDKENMQYLYHSIDYNKDIDFVTTDCFSNAFGIDSEVNLCALNATRSRMGSNQKESKLVFVAVIPQIDNTQSNVLCSEDIWTDNFEKFEKMISDFPAKASMLSSCVRIFCSFDCFCEQKRYKNLCG